MNTDAVSNRIVGRSHWQCGIFLILILLLSLAYSQFSGSRAVVHFFCFSIIVSLSLFVPGSVKDQKQRYKSRGEQLQPWWQDTLRQRQIKNGERNEENKWIDLIEFFCKLANVNGFLYWVAILSPLLRIRKSLKRSLIMTKKRWRGRKSKKKVRMKLCCCI